MSYVFDYLDQIRAILSRSPFGLITDVDGTISKTAPTPEKAKVSPLCRRYLARLSHQVALVAAISGRPAAQVTEMVEIDGMVYIGNHGLERWTGDHAEFSRRVSNCPGIIEAVVKELTPLLSIKGVSIENKGVTTTIHYRRSPDPQLAKGEILKSIAASTQARSLRIIKGRMSINLLPAIEINKGTATADLIGEYNLRGGIYLGDDVTDLDAFSAIHTACRNLDFRGLAIGIASPEMPEMLATEADFTLSGVSDVARFLRWLVRNVPQVS